MLSFNHTNVSARHQKPRHQNQNQGKKCENMIRRVAAGMSFFPLEKKTYLSFQKKRKIEMETPLLMRTHTRSQVCASAMVFGVTHSLALHKKDMPLAISFVLEEGKKNRKERHVFLSEGMSFS